MWHYAWNDLAKFVKIVTKFHYIFGEIFAFFIKIFPSLKLLVNSFDMKMGMDDIILNTCLVFMPISAELYRPLGRLFIVDLNI